MRHGKAWSWLQAAALACGMAAAAPASAEQIAVGNFGVSANGMPFAVALDKGFFKQEGIDVSGIITSAGGGTSLRNMIAGGVPYGEVNPGVVVAAILQGADLRIISDNVLTVAEFVWAVKPDSPIKALADIKGKKIGYTNPRSTSQALAQMVAQKAGLQPTDVELVRTGGFGEGYAALSTGMIDIAPIPEPLWAQYKDKLRPIAFASEILPPLSNVVGVTTANMAAEKGDFIRAVIRARRKAVAFMIENPDAAGDIVAKHYSLTPEVARAAVRNLVTSKTDGVEYWGSGQINMSGLKRMIDVQKGLGALSGDFDVTKMVDTQFLPEDIRTPEMSGGFDPAVHVSLRGVTKGFRRPDGGELQALGPIDLDLRRGEFFAVVGPSGCGKSTLLEVLAGLSEVTAGSVQFEGKPIYGEVMDGVGVVFQEDACFPWMTVADNIAFGLREAGAPSAEVDRRVAHALAMMGLEQFAQSYPAQLSGGMRQRVCIARTLVLQPRLILLDEPFGALDQQTRLLMGEELLRLWRETGATIFLITHALDEAAMLADRIGVMSARPGRLLDVIETGWPRDRDSRIVETAAFGQVTARLWQWLRGESLKSVGRVAAP